MKPRDIFSLEDLQMLEGVSGYDVDTLSHHVIDDVYTKVFTAKKAGTFIGQHSHKYDHGTLVATGEIRLFIDERWAGDFAAGTMIPIKRGVKHVLMSLADNTVCACIHNVHGALEPAVLEEATLG